MSFANRFGWSFSREATFNACRRRYYFHYYVSWGGWKTGASPIAREAFKLKRLASLPLWRGQLVHYVLSKVLQSMKAKGKIPDKEAVVGYTLERFETQYEFSHSKKYLSTPKKTRDVLNIDWLALFDHEYGRPITPAALEKIREECVHGIEGLYESSILSDIKETDRAAWDIEDIDGGSFSQQFNFGGVTIFVKTDFMYRGADGTLRIVDWKTSRGTESVAGAEEEEPRNAAVQLGIYGYYAARILREPITSIRLYEVDLLNRGRIIEHAADAESVARAEEHIKNGIALLRTVLQGGDTSRNEALPSVYFPKIENGLCTFCNFFRICEDESYPNRVP